MALTAALGIRDGLRLLRRAHRLPAQLQHRRPAAAPAAHRAVYAAVYYVVFRFLIRRFDLMTPGREPDDDADAAGVPAAGPGGGEPERR